IAMRLWKNLNKLLLSLSKRRLGSPDRDLILIMSSGREIRSKIQSIKSTEKITKAMELVAASKMRKALVRMTTSRPYAEKMRQVISHVAHSHSEYKHPYLVQRPEMKRAGFIIISSDRGLCGSLNVNLFRTALLTMRDFDQKGIESDLCLIG